MTIFGLLESGNGRLPEARFDSMAGATMLLRPAALSRRVDPPAALGAYGRRNDPERIEEREDLVVCLSGWIENREELRRELGLAPSAPASDPWLILSAYRRWGIDCPSRVAGPLTFALWDRRARRLLCARDALGIRPLFYTVGAERVVFGSQLRQVLAALDGRPDLDEEYFALFLLDGLPAPTTTPWVGIRKVPPGHSLVVEDGRAREKRHWRPEELDTIHFSDPRDYAARYLELFHRAVGVHLRESGPMWADLSGGLDSSSIVCVAQELIRAGEVEAPGFATLTLTFDAGAAGDDPRYVRSVLDKYPELDARSIVADRVCVFANMAEGAAYYDEPNQQIRFYELFRRYRETMSGSGSEVLLRGDGAEVGLLPEYPLPLHLADLLRSCRLGQFTTTLLEWQKALRLPITNLLAQCVIRPLTGPPRNRYYDDSVVPSWIHPSLVERQDLRSRANVGWMPRRFNSIGDQWQYEKAGRAASYFHRGYMEALVDHRYPFLYRPLVDYCIAIPYEHKVLPGHFKPILRRAMAGILPNEIRYRMSKEDISHWVVTSLARQWPALSPLFERPVLEELGFADGEKLRNAIRMFAHGQAERTMLTSSLVGLEIWTRYALGEPLEPVL